MGRTRDDLPDHEGYVLTELDRAMPTYAEDGWCSSSTPETREATPTGRHRAACGCGWRGPINSLGVMDIFLPEDLEDALLAGWEAHTAPLVSVGAVRAAADAMFAAQLSVELRVKEARDGGASWAQIAESLGVTKQAAQQRYG